MFEFIEVMMEVRERWRKEGFRKFVIGGCYSVFYCELVGLRILGFSGGVGKA